MIDVRLAATNPEDSTLVPVSCNSRGELNTVAPKIEEIPNDLKIDGDLTVTGLINGSDSGGEPGPPGPPGEPGGEGPQGDKGDPGEGVPLPYGEERSVLQVVNGVPAWGVVFEPEPEPPAFGVTCTNLLSPGKIFDQNGSQVRPADPNAYIQALPSWNNTGLMNFEGAVTSFWEIKDHNITEQYSFTGSLGKVLTLGWAFKFELEAYDDDHNPWTFEWDNQHIVYINDDLTNPPATTPGTDIWIQGYASFLINRDISAATLKVGKRERAATSWNKFLRYFALEDAGTFAVKRQIEMEKNMKALRGIVMDSDLLSQRQD